MYENNYLSCVYRCYEKCCEIISSSNLEELYLSSLKSGFSGFELLNDPYLPVLPREMMINLEKRIEEKINNENLQSIITLGNMHRTIVILPASSSLIGRHLSETACIIFQPFIFHCSS